ncbi:MAG TPA: choice-of-anchor D domain-containing protein [Solirubrobacteraceae bacterium]|jgi:hypothetical protein
MPVPASTAANIIRPCRSALRILPALVTAGVLGAGLGPTVAAATEPTTTTSYTSPGVYVFAVPAGIASISVTAIGAAGGASCDAASGGEGASMSATIPVSAGESLEVGVGGPGGIPSCGGGNIPGAGGTGGGGQGGAGVAGVISGGGGGGASALARSAPSQGFQAESELMIAGGGGGAGQEGGNGGNAGAAGSPNPGFDGGGGGGAGTQSAGGAGGTKQPDCAGEGQPEAGLAGTFGQGGQGGNFPEVGFTGSSAGGGGGGGYYGGGGGGAGCRGGGGGGGSSFAAASVTVTEAPTPTAQPSGITITYAVPTAELSGGSLEFTATQPQGVASTAQTLTVTNGGAAPLVVSSATLGGTNPDDYLLDNRCQTPVAVGSSCKISVRFDPQAQGASSATLTLQTNAASAPAPVALSGTGGSLPQGSQGATGPNGAQGATGEQGPPGTNGAQGTQGPAGTPGEVGPRSATGKRGPAGRRGAAGETRFMNCTAHRVGAPGHGPAHGPAVRTACTSQLGRNPLSLPRNIIASASLTRSGHMYATGKLAAGQLALYSRDPLPPGNYTLTLHWRSGAITHTSRRQFQVA